MISSAARSAGYVSILAKAFLFCSASTGSTPSATRAFVAILVRMPPGWTTVTPTGRSSASSSERRDSLNPRRPYLLVE